mmetsp:Transcript_122347/g.290839  ORF Transcript_122347/g.290839 Transcript_122347/m.290839 type:complete len:436 (-) Transcript_122347:965-2272(-)
MICSSRRLESACRSASFPCSSFTRARARPRSSRMSSSSFSFISSRLRSSCWCFAAALSATACHWPRSASSSEHLLWRSPMRAVSDACRSFRLRTSSSCCFFCAMIMATSPFVCSISLASRAASSPAAARASCSLSLVSFSWANFCSACSRLRRSMRTSSCRSRSVLSCCLSAASRCSCSSLPRVSATCWAALASARRRSSSCCSWTPKLALASAKSRSASCTCCWPRWRSAASASRSFCSEPSLPWRSSSSLSRRSEVRSCAHFCRSSCNSRLKRSKSSRSFRRWVSRSRSKASSISRFFWSLSSRSCCWERSISSRRCSSSASRCRSSILTLSCFLSDKIRSTSGCSPLMVISLISFTFSFSQDSRFMRSVAIQFCLFLASSLAPWSSISSIFIWNFRSTAFSSSAKSSQRLVSSVLSFSRRSTSLRCRSTPAS